MDNYEIVKQRTFFEVPIHIHTGEILNKEDDLVYKLNGDEKEYIEDENYVIARFNDTVYENFKKYIRPIVQSRGIKVVAEVDMQDHDVQEIIKKSKSKKKQERLSQNEISAIITRVRNMHEPQYMLIAFQTLLWAMLYEDMFTVNAKGIESRFDVDIPEDYWGGAKSTNPLDALLPKDTLPPEPFLDKTHPLETMLAVVTTFLNLHPELSDALQPYNKRVYVAINYLQNTGLNKLDATFLGSQLDSVLSEDVEQGD